MLESSRYPPARAKKPHAALFLPLTKWNKHSSLTNPPDILFFFFFAKEEYGLDLNKLCYSRNVLHLNEESKRKEARNLYCLVNRQFLGGYNTLVPIYCPPSLLTPPFLWNLPGWQEETVEGMRTATACNGKVWPLSTHLNVTTPCKHSQRTVVFLSKITVMPAFPFSRNTIPPHLWYSCLSERIKERRERRGGAWPTTSFLQHCPPNRASWQNMLLGTSKELSITYEWLPKETSPGCQGESSSQ